MSDLNRQQGTTSPNERVDLHNNLRIEGVSVSYNSQLALDDICFNISGGRRLALIGPNGAGKTTLLKAVAGLVPITNGHIKWCGNSLIRSNGELAYLAQLNQIDWDFPLTVRGLVEMGRYPHVGWWRKFGKKDQDVVEAALKTMHLEELSDRQIRALSGGQQQRAFVARALAQEARILLLDEPFTGLDQPSQELLSNLLEGLAAEGRIVIASHHDLESVAENFDDELLLNRRLLAFGVAAEVLSAENLSACFSDLASTDIQKATGVINLIKNG